MVPELNFLSVDVVAPRSRILFRNVRKDVELSPTLFEPPPGVVMKYVDEPMGIVMRGPGDSLPTASAQPESKPQASSASPEHH
jgi:hypothetical protein